jgi:hypothetical protein
MASGKKELGSLKLVSRSFSDRAQRRGRAGLKIKASTGYSFCYYAGLGGRLCAKLAGRVGGR